MLQSGPPPHSVQCPLTHPAEAPPCSQTAMLARIHSAQCWRGQQAWCFRQQHGVRSAPIGSTRPSWKLQARKGLAELLTLRKPELDSKQLKQGVVSKRLAVPESITRPNYVRLQESPWGDDPQIHNSKADGIKPDDLRKATIWYHLRNAFEACTKRQYQDKAPEARDKMRAACRLAAEILQMAGKLVKPGVATDFIDRKVHEMAVANGAYPSPLGYGGFPKSVCTSVNECLCHGIPDSRELQDGDTINIDVTVFLNGYHGDTSAMFPVGNVAAADWKMCEVTEAARDAAIAACGPGVPINEIGRVIHQFAEKNGYGCVSEMVGHGVGTVFHAHPPIFHTRNREPGKMMPWQTFTIEPIFVAGNTRHQTWKDKWTMVTKDRKRAAQWEHTVLITDKGHEILTQL